MMRSEVLDGAASEDARAARAMRTLQETMARAARVPDLAARLALVDAAVLVHDHDGDHPGVWLRFGGEQLEVGPPPADAEPDVCLRMPVDLLECFPFFHLAMAMADGRVTYEGDDRAVREVIALIPVLRTAVAS